MNIIEFIDNNQCMFCEYSSIQKRLIKNKRLLHYNCRSRLNRKGNSTVFRVTTAKKYKKCDLFSYRQESLKIPHYKRNRYIGTFSPNLSTPSYAFNSGIVL